MHLTIAPSLDIGGSLSHAGRRIVPKVSWHACNPVPSWKSQGWSFWIYDGGSAHQWCETLLSSASSPPSDDGDAIPGLFFEKCTYKITLQFWKSACGLHTLTPVSSLTYFKRFTLSTLSTLSEAGMSILSIFMVCVTMKPVVHYDMIWHNFHNDHPNSVCCRGLQASECLTLCRGLWQWVLIQQKNKALLWNKSF